MLFKRKDNSDAAKAKTSFFAGWSKQRDALDLSKEMAKPVEKTHEHEHAEKTFKQTQAAGKISPDILKRPRITEKATGLSAVNVYVFDIAQKANKTMVAAAVRDVYGVSPRQVRVAAVPRKTKTNRRGQKGVKGGGKKAYVYLKRGDTIELV